MLKKYLANLIYKLTKPVACRPIRTDPKSGYTR